jgi:hypothetical protein
MEASRGAEAAISSGWATLAAVLLGFGVRPARIPQPLIEA